MRPAPYAQRLRIHLAASRRAGLPWEHAARKAHHELVAETDSGLCSRWVDCKEKDHSCKQIREWFRDAYLGIGNPRLAQASALVENERWTDKPAYHAPAPGRRQCGWGGSPCERMGEPYLCAEHAAIIDAVPPYCLVKACGRNATEDEYCAKHAHLHRGQKRAGQVHRERTAA